MLHAGLRSQDLKLGTEGRLCVGSVGRRTLNGESMKLGRKKGGAHGGTRVTRRREHEKTGGENGGTWVDRLREKRAGHMGRHSGNMRRHGRHLVDILETESVVKTGE